MKQLAATYPLAAKALRIALTFMLVFFTSLHVEHLAFGAEAPTIYTNEPAEGEGFLREIVIYDVKGANDYSKIISTNDKDPGSGKAAIDQRQGERIFYAVASWEDADGKALTTDDGKPWLTSADSLIDWKVDSSLLTLTNDNGFKRVQAAGTEDGNVPIECTVKSSVKAERLGPSLNSKNAWVTVALSNQPEPEPEPDPEPDPEPEPKDPYITSIQILDENGAAIESGSINLNPEQTSYGFQALVAIIDPEATVEEGQAVTVICTPDKGLGTALNEMGVQFVSGFTFQDSDLSWHVEGSDAASISEYGVLSAPNDGSTFTVRCTTDKGENVSGVVTVTTGEPAKEDPYVTSLEILKADGLAFEEGEELNIESPTEGGESEGDGEEGGETQVAESATYQFQARVTYYDPETETETIYTLTADGWSTDAGPVADLPFDVTWEPTENVTGGGLLTLRNGQTVTVRAFTVNGKDGASHESSVVVHNTTPDKPQPTDAKVTIGYTPVAKDEEALLTAQPEGVEGYEYHFVWERSTDEGATWEDLEETGEVLTVTTDDEHIGYWYRVRMEVEGMEEPVRSEHVVITVAEVKPSVTIKYTPVAKDETTTLVAEPTNVEGIDYTLAWEESTDNGTTWTTVEGQTELTMDVKTDDEHIGRMYRARMDIPNTEDPEAQEPIYSDPVTIHVKDETVGVVIAYDPVPTGQTAHLQAVPRNIGTASPTYSWELSTDQGTTWTPTQQTSTAIDVPTDKEHIGQQYRVQMKLEGVEEPYYSNVVEIKDGTDDGSPKVVVYYTPVPKGEIATLVQHPKNVGPLTWIAYWEESTDGGQTWHELAEESQQLDVMTDDEHIGRQYRARNDVLEPSEYTMYSNIVTIVEGPNSFRVSLKLDYKTTGQNQTLVSDVKGEIPDGSKENLTYIWEVSTDQGINYSIIDGEHGPTMTVLTDSSVLGNLYRVRARTPKGAEAISTPQMLAAIDDKGQDGDTPDPPDDSPKDFTPVDPGDIDTGGGDNTQDPTNPPTDPTNTPTDQNAQPEQPQEQPQQQSEQQANKPETMSEMVDRLGEVGMVYDDGTTATMKPLDQLDVETMNKTPEEATTPGLRLRELYRQQEIPNISDILVDNPFGQLLIPFVLAVMAAGALEKYLRYREQRRPSLITLDTATAVAS